MNTLHTQHICSFDAAIRQCEHVTVLSDTCVCGSSREGNSGRADEILSLPTSIVLRSVTTAHAAGMQLNR
jgi:hypothetical protein